MLPQRREDKLLIEELPDETLVYDRVRYKGHCLNRVAGLVWKHCDGKTSVAKLAGILRKELNQPVDEELVWLTLEQLGKAHLLQEPPATPENVRAVSRRDAMKKLAGLSAVALVASVVVPTSAQAACSPLPPCNANGAACNCNAQCCSVKCKKSTCTCVASGGPLCPNAPCPTC